MKLAEQQSAPHGRTQFDIPFATLALIAPLYSTRAPFSEDPMLQPDVLRGVSGEVAPKMRVTRA